jgi:glutathione synthase/RimK-type ligase-like ATP-grasp enzyme
MIAIHQSGNWSFRPEWEAYCKRNNLSYKLVDAYRSDIINQLKGCSCFLFHRHHTSAKDVIFSAQLLYALEQSGVAVFPNFHTAWHFDDKLGQKYLLEAIGAPMAKSEVFFSKEEAQAYIESATWPMVFKLRGGAGSNNVSLVKTKLDALNLMRKCFGRGFSNYNRIGDLRETFRRKRLGMGTTNEFLKSIRRLVVSTEFSKTAGRERGYMLLQEFIPNNDCDIRVIVIGQRAFAIKRMIRENDFRASGSGYIRYEKEQIPIETIRTAFEVTAKLDAQCLAYDFVFDTNGIPLIVEINFGFAHRSYDACPGYWNPDLSFVETKIDPCGWMIEDFIKSNSNGY